MWLIFATLSALGISARNLISKVNIDKNNEYLTMWSTTFFALLFGIPFVIWKGFEITEVSFWGFVAIRVVMDTIAFFTFTKALKMESISFVIPLIAILPVLASVTAFFINGETISPMGILGIIIICLSTLVLFLIEIDFSNFRKNKETFIATGLVMVTILFWSVLDSLHKQGIERSNPYTYFVIGNIFFTIIFSVLLVITKTSLKILRNPTNFKINASLGILLGIEFLSQLVALTTGKVAYVSAIKSMNIVITPIFAWIFLKEKYPTEKMVVKFIGILASLSGIFILLLS